tara:strand:- start:74451 stop:75170 length:720 start_codon:yes stop_codon:yes gene_type:complete
MRSCLLITLISSGLTASFALECFGQLSVQQPVIQSTGGNFVVSVPDRGGILLGSISRVGETRKSYGLPFLRGSSVGRFSQHSSLSAHVWIHDLREMDRVILEMAETDPQGLPAETSAAARRAGLAWSDYRPRRGVSVDDRSPARVRLLSSQESRFGVLASGRNSATGPERLLSEPQRNVSVEDRSPAIDPVRHYRLGVEAEESGKLSLAKLHYQAAAQYGSTEGARRLRELAVQPVAAK